MEEFEVGDVVQLKSGGPVMTVTSVSENGDVTVHWFPTSDERGVSTASFPGEALKAGKPG